MCCRVPVCSSGISDRTTEKRRTKCGRGKARAAKAREVERPVEGLPMGGGDGQTAQLRRAARAAGAGRGPRRGLGLAEIGARGGDGGAAASAKHDAAEGERWRCQARRTKGHKRALAEIIAFPAAQPAHKDFFFYIVGVEIHFAVYRRTSPGRARNAASARLPAGALQANLHLPCCPRGRPPTRQSTSAIAKIAWPRPSRLDPLHAFGLTTRGPSADGCSRKRCGPRRPAA